MKRKSFSRRGGQRRECSMDDITPYFRPYLRINFQALLPNPSSNDKQRLGSTSSLAAVDDTNTLSIGAGTRDGNRDGNAVDSTNVDDALLSKGFIPRKAIFHPTDSSLLCVTCSNGSVFIINVITCTLVDVIHCTSVKRTIPSTVFITQETENSATPSVETKKD